MPEGKIEVPSRSPTRGPPYWKSRVLRLQTAGDDSDGGDHGRGDEAAKEAVAKAAGLDRTRAKPREPRGFGAKRPAESTVTPAG